MTADRMLTTRDVAARLGYTQQTISRRAHLIPGAVKILGRWRFDPDQLDAWLESRKHTDTWAAPRRGFAA